MAPTPGQELAAAEQQVQENEIVKRSHLSRYLGAFGVGVVAALGVGTVAWGYFNRNEQPVTTGPAQELVKPDDGVLRVATWNMNRNAASHINQIKKLMRSEDVLVMQEVTRDDDKAISESLSSEYYVTYKLADAKQKPLSGGLGNMIITTRKPEKVESKRIDGGSMQDTYGKTTTGVVDDLSQGDLSLPAARKGLLENRSILSVTTKAIGAMSVRFITTHIAASPYRVHESQMRVVLKYAEEAKEPGIPVVLCADLNEKDPERVIVPFGMQGYITREVTQPTTTSGYAIDYCTYYPAGKLGLMRTQVIPGYVTDHKLVEGVVALAPA